jgi:hypothetical protein
MGCGTAQATDRTTKIVQGDGALGTIEEGIAQLSKAALAKAADAGFLPRTDRLVRRSLTFG